MKTLPETLSIPRWYPKSMIMALFRLMVGMMDLETKTVSGMSQDKWITLLRACRDADTFAASGNTNEAALALKYLTLAGWVERLPRERNDPHKYVVLLDINPEERQECLSYLLDAQHRLRLKYEKPSSLASPFHDVRFAAPPSLDRLTASANNSRRAKSQSQEQFAYPKPSGEGKPKTYPCERCGDPIVWAKNQHGNYTPLNAEMLPVYLEGDRQHIVVVNAHLNERQPVNFCITPGRAYAARVHGANCPP